MLNLSKIEIRGTGLARSALLDLAGLLLGDPHLPHFARLLGCRIGRLPQSGSFWGVPFVLPHPLEGSEFVGGCHSGDASVPLHDRLVSIKPDAHVFDEDGLAGVGDDCSGLAALAALALSPSSRNCDVGDDVYRENSALIWEGLDAPCCCLRCRRRRCLSGGDHP
ncbi:hypothetical protein Taro_012197 [Colocasia esculenta]|uniref:Uncharacterized protein n=1 Tax=Colocasia esculenta TaxID=4460 RepID=A0A843UIC3_COLES|nr:hypothetical protein [Colocasia esculenta]